MAEQIPFTIAGQLISLLGSPALEEIKLAYGTKKELKKLKARLTSINAVLRHADEQQQKNKPGVEEWIRRLKEVLYDADDLLDDVAAEGLRQKVNPRGRIAREVGDFFSSSNQIVFRVKLGHKIKEVREKLDEVVKDMSQFNFLTDKVVVDLGVISNRRETDSEVLKDEIIGREKNENDIIQLLQQPGDQNQKNVSVVAIVGMGGLGKTTLAQKVYNNEWVERYFGERMWVCVSEDFNGKTIARKILKCLIRDEVGDLDLQQLQSHLREKLEGKRYLLVLDDVWNENEERWDSLRKLLFHGAQGSKIIVTTRSKKVALVMGVDVETNSLYELEGLSNKESCILFEQKIYRGRDEKPSSATLLLEIGKELVTKRCKGVPLAIKTLASAVRSYPNEAYWSSMKENEMWSLLSNEDDGDGILPVLKLSYYHLPNHLKQCFAYCFIFPKDFEISKHMLVQHWMAHGYVQSSTGGKDLEEVGDMYFHELLSRSFFQQVRKDDCGNIISCKMHDLIHDLAQLVSRNDCLILPFDKEKKIIERVHHAALFEEKIKWNEIVRMLKSICEEKASLRTLILSSPMKAEEEIKSCIQDLIFSKMKSLRVLVLDSKNVELPSSFGKLKHLRHLSLFDFKFKKLPDAICDLFNLQTLFLSACKSLEELPEDLSKLVSLRHLVIEDCRNLICMPMGFGKLTLLRELPTIYVTKESKGYVLNELCALDLLRGNLCLEGLKNVKNVELEAKQVSLKPKKYLQSLTFTWSFEYHEDDDDDDYDSDKDDVDTIIKRDELLLDYLEPHVNLKALTVKGYRGGRFPAWLSCITNLVRLVLDNCNKCRHLPPLDQLHSLMYLELNWMRSLEYVESSSMTMTNRFFPSLEELSICFCVRFKGWWRRSNDDGDEGANVDDGLQPCNWFPRLARLRITYCPKLSSMPLFPTLQKKLTLEWTSVKPLQQTMEMEITNRNTDTASSSSSSICLLSSSPLDKLKRLELEHLRDLQSAALPEERLRCLTSLEYLEIVNCSNLTSLPDWVRHLPSLQRLRIKECKKVSRSCRKDKGPDWWKIQHIPSISTDFEEFGHW